MINEAQLHIEAVVNGYWQSRALPPNPEATQSVQDLIQKYNQLPSGEKLKIKTEIFRYLTILTGVSGAIQGLHNVLEPAVDLKIKAGEDLTFFIILLGTLLLALLFQESQNKVSKLDDESSRLFSQLQNQLAQAGIDQNDLEGEALVLINATGDTPLS
jgi:hypothetical protein